MRYLKKNKVNEMIELSQDLVSFGLNPRDWKLVRETEKTYRIESDEDEEFVFRGSAMKKKSKSRWEQIEIVSL